MAEKQSVETPAEEPQDTFAIRGETQPLTFNLESAFARAGIPPKIQEQLSKARKPEPETHGEDARLNQEVVPRGTTEPEAVKPAEPEPPAPEPESEPAPVPTAEEETAKLTKQVEELTGKTTKLEEERKEFEAKAKTLESQLQGVEPIVLAPSASDPLAAVTNTAQLKAAHDRAKLIRDWADDNIEGITINEGTDKEEVIDAKRMRQYRREAEDLLLQHIPQKQAQLNQKATFDQAARVKFPELMTRGSEDYNTAQSLLQDFPALVNHPARNMLLGIFLLGYKTDQERSKATAKNGDKSDIPAALLKPHAPIAPAVANRPSRVVAPANNKKNEEMKSNIIKSRGDPKVAAQALRERWEQEGRFSTKKKVLV